MFIIARKISRIPVSLDGTSVVRPLVEVATDAPVTVTATLDAIVRDQAGISLRLVAEDGTSGIVRIDDPALVRAHGHQFQRLAEVTIRGRVQRDQATGMPRIDATAITT